MENPTLDRNIDLEIAAKEAEIKNLNNRASLYYFIGGIFILSLLFTIFGRQLLLTIVGPDSLFFRSIPLMGAGMTVYCLFLGGYTFIIRQSKIGAMQQELDVLHAKRRLSVQSTGQASAEKPTSYFERLVDINITNLEAYYGLVRIHTNNSFQVAIFAGFVGFLLIATGIIIGFIGSSRAENLSYITTSSGVITEFIGGIFFYLYNRTVRQLKEYHDSLIRVQNILLSFKIVGDTQDGNQKNILMELMMRCLITKDGIAEATPPKITNAG